MAHVSISLPIRGNIPCCAGAKKTARRKKI